jgi:hypothetical protein
MGNMERARSLPTEKRAILAPTQKIILLSQEHATLSTFPQTCRDVIQILLRENDMEDQIPHYAIYVADSGGRERALEMGERPKEMLDGLKAAGTCTELIIRKRMPDEDTPPPGPPSQDQDFGYQGGPDGMGGPRRDYGPMPDLLCQMILSTMKRPATARH